MKKIGGIPFETPAMLAPMAGISDLAFRTLMRRRGSAVSVTELVSADGLVRGGAKTLEMCKYLPEERPFAIQLFGSTAEMLARGIEVCQRLGVDFVDLNFGCPVPKVVNKGSGAAMTRDPCRLQGVLETLVKGMSVPLTIKIRTGWDAHSINALEVVQAAEAAGVAWVAIHGRTRAQGYSGQADWALIERVARAVRIPVIGNGDLIDARQALGRLAGSGCAAVMIGRGALRDPWILAETAAVASGLPPPGPRDFVALLGELRDLLVGHYPLRHALLQMKKFSMWFSFGFPGAREFRKTAFTGETVEAVWNRARAFFDSVAHIDVAQKDRGFFLKGGHG